MKEVRNYLTNDLEMQADRKRLVGVCCSAELPESVQGAPIPASIAAEAYGCGAQC